MTLDDPSDELSERGALRLPRRVIKRYSNRKLYDTQESRYVTLLQIADLVRGGADVQIIDNATKEDKTDVTLALIVSEELKARPRGIPLATLKALIRARGERLLLQLKGGTLGKLISKDESGAVDSPAESSDTQSVASVRAEEDAGPVAAAESVHSGIRATLEQWQRTVDEQLRVVFPFSLEQWQRTVDEQIRAVLPSFSAFRELQGEVARLADRVAVLERQLGGESAAESAAERLAKE